MTSPKYGLKQSGIVDEATVKAINAQVAQRVSIDKVLTRLDLEIARYKMQVNYTAPG